jgi:hypothetical protein
MVLIAVVSALAVGVFAAMASATPQFVTGPPPTYPATISGESAKGNLDLALEAGSVECKNTIDASLPEASSTLDLALTYSSCQAYGFLSATVNPEGCTFPVQASEEVATDKFKGLLGISCPAGKSIKIVASTCTAEVKAQSGLATVALDNDPAAAPAAKVTFGPALTGIAYTVTSDGFLCPFGGTGNKTGATLSANAAIALAAEEAGSEEPLALRVEP